MLYKADAKKGRGLEELLEQLQPNSLEEQRKLLVVGNSPLKSLFEKYESGLSASTYSQLHRVLGSVSEVLTPSEIDAFLQATLPYENTLPDKNTFGYVLNTSKFITGLIQNSYNAGFNNFVIHTLNIKPFDSLGSIQVHDPASKCRESYCNQKEGLMGELSRPIEITYVGNVGSHFGLRSTGVHYTVKGNAGYGCGPVATDCTFTLEGKVAHFDTEQSQRCIFRTSNRELLQQMKDEIIFHPIVFIGEDGSLQRYEVKDLEAYRLQRDIQRECEE